MLESASFCAGSLSSPSCCIVSPPSHSSFCNSALFPRFCLHHCPVSVRLTYRHAFPGPLFLSLARGRCLACALLCASQGRMSACRTRPAANPGGPQGGAQTGRSPGGGAGRKLSRPRFETKGCGGFPGTPPGPSRLSERTHGDSHTGDQNSQEGITNLQSAPHYNHKYKQTIMRTIKPQYNVNVMYHRTKPRTRPYSIQNRAMV